MGSMMATMMERRLEERVEARVEERVKKEVAERVKERVVAAREEMRAESLARERARLSRQAAWRFGALAAARLSALIDDVEDDDVLDEIWQDLADRADAGELLARAEAAAGRG